MVRDIRSTVVCTLHAGVGANLQYAGTASRVIYVTAFRYLTSAPFFHVSMSHDAIGRSHTPPPKPIPSLARPGSITIYIAGDCLEWRMTGVYDASPIAEEAICLVMVVVVVVVMVPGDAAADGGGVQ